MRMQRPTLVRHIRGRLTTMGVGRESTGRRGRPKEIDRSRFPLQGGWCTDLKAGDLRSKTELSANEEEKPNRASRSPPKNGSSRQPLPKRGENTVSLKRIEGKGCHKCGIRDSWGKKQAQKLPKQPDEQVILDDTLGGQRGRR